MLHPCSTLQKSAGRGKEDWAKIRGTCCPVAHPSPLLLPACSDLQESVGRVKQMAEDRRDMLPRGIPTQPPAIRA